MLGNFEVIPHTRALIQFKSGTGTRFIPRFSSAITGPLKNVRKFYERPMLTSYPAVCTEEAYTKLIKSDDTPLIYAGADPAETCDYPYLNANFFSVDPDEVAVAIDDVHWSGGIHGTLTGANTLMPLVDAANQFVVAGTVVNPVATTMAFGGTVSVSIDFSGVSSDYRETAKKTLVISLVSGSDSLYLKVPVTDVADINKGAYIIASDGTPATSAIEVTWSGDTCTIAPTVTSGGGFDTYALEHEYGDDLYAFTGTQALFPDDAYIEDRYVYIDSNDSAATYKANISTLLYGMSKLNVIDTASDAGHVHILTTVDSGFEQGSSTYVCEVSESINLFSALAVEVDTALHGNLALRESLYTNEETYKTDITPGTTVGTTSILSTAFWTQVAAVEDKNENNPAVAFVHAEYIADYKLSTEGNAFTNQPYKYDGTGFVPSQGSDQVWGLPLPDNPIGLAAYIFSTIATTDSTYIVVADTKVRAFDTISAYESMIFISNVWEEIGSGGLNEASWIDARRAINDFRQVTTWKELVYNTYHRGTETTYNTYKVTCRSGERDVFDKDGSDTAFTSDLSAGDMITVLQTDGVETAHVIVTVASDHLVIADELASSEDGDALYYRAYTARTNTQVKNDYVLAQSKTTETCFVSLNKTIAWGDESLSNKFLAPAMLALIVSYPEQAPLYKISINVGNFGAVTGAIDFFTATQLDELVRAGYWMFNTEPDSQVAYVLKDVSLGMSTGDYKRGNKNAVVPIFTFGTSCRQALDRYAGRMNTVDEARQKVSVAAQAVVASYTGNPLPDLGSKLRRAKLTSVTETASGFKFKFATVPQKAADIFEIEITVENNGEES